MARTSHGSALVLTGLAIAVVATACGRAQSAPPDLFKTGRQYVVAGEYAQAIPPLTEYLRHHPTGKHASRAGLFLGKAHVGLGQWAEARAAWERTVEEHGASLEGHKCRYKLAWLAMIEGDDETALAGFTALAENPTGPLAPEAGAMARFLSTPAQAPVLESPGEREE